jgi:hypothetical protein
MGDVIPVADQREPQLQTQDSSPNESLVTGYERLLSSSTLQPLQGFSEFDTSPSTFQHVDPAHRPGRERRVLDQPATLIHVFGVGAAHSVRPHVQQRHPMHVQIHLPRQTNDSLPGHQPRDRPDPNRHRDHPRGPGPVPQAPPGRGRRGRVVRGRSATLWVHSSRTLRTNRSA